MKEKEAEAREKAKEAGLEVSLMAAERSEATQVIEEVLKKGKTNKKLKDENDVSKTRKEAVKLLDAPPGLELNAATLAVARIQGNEVMDENDVQKLCQKVDAMPKVKGKGKGKGSGKRTTKGKCKGGAKGKGQGEKSKGKGSGKGANKGKGKGKAKKGSWKDSWKQNSKWGNGKALASWQPRAY